MHQASICQQGIIVNKLDINKAEILKGPRVSEIISQAVDLGLDAAMCRMCGGKWMQDHLKFSQMLLSDISYQVPIANKTLLESIKINQPVGISFHFEFHKYIFDSTITGLDSTQAESKILLAIPEHIEKMPRRAYERQPVPHSLNVNVLFWHRGYADNSSRIPNENYWQGKLVNLSAGGMQISTALEELANFQIRQLIGIQFTPMYYQKPILVEGQIVHIHPNHEEGKLNLGIEFLGLEVSIDGRNTLHRLMDTVQEYSRQNNHTETNR